MSLSKDSTIRALNDCGCCEGLDIQSPQVIHNRPGLSAVAYRVGKHSRFKATMLARLSSSDLPALNNLTSRSDADFSIALLDVWAAVADVLTFYQERIANEAYLRTATEPYSLVELASLVGYVPRPGVAASAYLAFTLEDAGVPDDVPVPIGTRVQSIPGPGEKPQFFETIEAIAGRPEWNAIKPLLFRKHPDLKPTTTTVTVREASVNVQKGDNLLLVCGPSDVDKVVQRVITVTPDPVAQTTRIDMVSVPVEPEPFRFIFLALATWNSQPSKLTATSVGNNVLQGSWRQADLNTYARVQSWPLLKLATNLRVYALAQLKLAPVDKGVFAFRQRAAIFGHNAPNWSLLPDPKPGTNWEGLTLSTDLSNKDTSKIDLDNVYPGIVQNSWVVLRNQYNHTHVYTVNGYAEISRSDFTLSSKVSRLELNSQDEFTKFELRDTTVFAQSEKLELAELPINDVIKDNKLLLDGPYLGLQVGRPVVVTGKRTDLPGVTDSEVMILADVKFDQGYTEITFTSNLANEYERTSVTINANVALATHGETRHQTLGNGDANKPFQTFKLPELPLTHLRADNTKGSASTLQVRVNQLLWQEVDFLYGRGPDEHVYIMRTDDQGQTFIQFGDGQTGARLPTGQENVQVTFRKGIGMEGLVREAQLSLLLTKPLGVRSVTNPVAAGDAASAESLEDVRRNALLPIRTLDRIVSLLDYEDFAHAFPGVAKALATWTWNGQQRGVFLTIAGALGNVITENSLTYKNLISAILQAGDPNVSLRVRSYTPVFFRLAGKVSIDPSYLSEKVLAGVEAALRTAFSFDARRLGQLVAKSELIAAMQAVKGVLAVDLDEFYRIDATAEELANTQLFDTLTAQVPRAGIDGSVGAELLLLDPRPVSLEVMNA
jgi:hypothetical protein